MQTSMEHVSLLAPDISCGHCVNAIQNRIGNLKGVKSVHASVDTQAVGVEFDPSQITLTKLKDELDDEGYPVKE